MPCRHWVNAWWPRALADVMAMAAVAAVAVPGELGVGCGKGPNGLFHETHDWNPGFQVASGSDAFAESPVSL